MFLRQSRRSFNVGLDGRSSEPVRLSLRLGLYARIVQGGLPAGRRVHGRTHRGKGRGCHGGEGGGSVGLDGRLVGVGVEGLIRLWVGVGLIGRAISLVGWVNLIGLVFSLLVHWVVLVKNGLIKKNIVFRG